MKRSCRDVLLLTSALAGIAAFGWGGAAWGAEPNLQFDIPSEPLGRALTDFSRISSRQIVFSEDVAAGRTTAGLHGRYTPQGALSALLAGTNLRVEQDSAGVFAVVAPGMAAAAAGVPAADETSPQPAQVETVVVTAQKRVENLQRVPTSAIVISGQALAQNNINSLDALSQVTPSLHVGASTVIDNEFIRGIGSGKSATFDQAVGTFVDDIYFGRSRSTAGTFLDLENLEVLKGPQSTFFGNNVIAGAFNIVTKKPGNTFDASGRVLAGSYGQYAVEAEAGGPVTDNFGARFALIADGQTGWLTDSVTKKHLPQDDALAGRATFVYKPTDNLDVTLKVEGDHDNESGALGIQITNCPPAAPFTPKGFCASALSSNTPTGTNNSQIAQTPGQGTNFDLNEYVLTTNYHKWGQTFTSVTGFYSQHFDLKLDEDGQSANLLTATTPEAYNQFSQEFRVASPTNQPIEYLAGVYFQADHLVAKGGAGTYSLYSANFTAGNPALAAYEPLGKVSDTFQYERDYGVFGSVSWNVTDALKLTGSLRGTYDQKLFSFDSYFGTSTGPFGNLVPLPASVNPAAIIKLLGAVGAVNSSSNESALLPSANIQYKITPEAMVYARYDRGFLAGGFSTVALPAVAPNPAVVALNPFSPESVNAYEVGLKSQWFDNSLRFNIDLFRSDYTDLQVSQNSSFGPTITNVVTNAGKSLTQGVELDMQWAVNDHVRFTANGAYDDAHYVSYKNVTDTQLQAYCHTAPANNPYCVAAFGGTGAFTTYQDLSGEPTSFAPRWSGSLTGTYTTLLPDDFRFTGQLTVTYASSAFSDAGTDDPLTLMPAWTRLDGQLTVQTPDKHWALDLIGKNLTNETIIVNIYGLATSAGSNFAEKAEPQNFAVQLRYRW